MKLRTTLLVLAFAAGGCTTMDYSAVGGREKLTNAKGHVIGYKERLCDCKAGEELDRVVLFTPRLGENGGVVAYEERVRGGVVLWDEKGKRIGSRYVDLRSRGTNAHNSGLMIVFRPRESEPLAQLTIEDVKQHLGISN